jgi:hypothetical protein
VKTDRPGLAKMKVHDLTTVTQKTIMGTTKWCAPGACAADLLIDWKKADAYSFAIRCTEILTGKTPFSSGLPTLYARIMRRDRPKLPSFPEDLTSLIEAW